MSYEIKGRMMLIVEFVENKPRGTLQRRLRRLVDLVDVSS